MHISVQECSHVCVAPRTFTLVTPANTANKELSIVCKTAFSCSIKPKHGKMGLIKGACQSFRQWRYEIKLTL